MTASRFFLALFHNNLGHRNKDNSNKVWKLEQVEEEYTTES